MNRELDITSNSIHDGLQTAWLHYTNEQQSICNTSINNSQNIRAYIHTEIFFLGGGGVIIVRARNTFSRAPKIYESGGDISTPHFQIS